MGWFFLLLVLHLLFGLSCAYLAYETKLRAEPWFVAGILLGGVALLTCLLYVRHCKTGPRAERWLTLRA